MDELAARRKRHRDPDPGFALLGDELSALLVEIEERDPPQNLRQIAAHLAASCVLREYMETIGEGAPVALIAALKGWADRRWPREGT